MDVGCPSARCRSLADQNWSVATRLRFCGLGWLPGSGWSVCDAFFFRICLWCVCFFWKNSNFVQQKHGVVFWWGGPRGAQNGCGGLVGGFPWPGGGFCVVFVSLPTHTRHSTQAGNKRREKKNRKRADLKEENWQRRSESLYCVNTIGTLYPHYGDFATKVCFYLHHFKV